MPYKRTSRIIRNRAQAFARQSGRCYYCSAPMWLTDPAAFVKRYGLTTAQARGYQRRGCRQQRRHDHDQRFGARPDGVR